MQTGEVLCWHEAIGNKDIFAYRETDEESDSKIY